MTSPERRADLTYPDNKLTRVLGLCTIDELTERVFELSGRKGYSSAYGYIPPDQEIVNKNVVDLQGLWEERGELKHQLELPDNVTRHRRREQLRRRLPFIGGAIGKTALELAWDEIVEKTTIPDDSVMVQQVTKSLSLYASGPQIGTELEALWQLRIWQSWLEYERPLDGSMGEIPNSRCNVFSLYERFTNNEFEYKERAQKFVKGNNGYVGVEGEGFAVDEIRRGLVFMVNRGFRQDTLDGRDNSSPRTE